MAHPERSLFDQEHTGDPRNKVRTGTYAMRKGRSVPAVRKPAARPVKRKLPLKQRAKRVAAAGLAIGAIGAVVDHSLDKSDQASIEATKKADGLRASIAGSEAESTSTEAPAVESAPTAIPDTTGSTELDPATAADQTVDLAPEDSTTTTVETAPDTGGLPAEDSPDTGGVDATSSDVN